MLIDMEKIYHEFENFSQEDWDKVDREMRKIIAKREAEEKGEA